MTAQEYDSDRSVRSALIYMPLTFLLASLLSWLFYQALLFLGADSRWAIVGWPLLFLLLMTVVARQQRIDQLDLLTAFGAAAAALIASHVVIGAITSRWLDSLPAFASIAIQLAIWLLGYAALAFVWLGSVELSNGNGQGTSLTA